MMINGQTKIVGLIGDPVSHSVSPQMHNEAFSELGLNYCYIPIRVSKNDLKKAIEGIRAFNIVGVNVTIPHKESVIPLLDEVTKLPKLIGAVNTILNQDGKLIGFNTDGPGFIESLERDGGIKAKGKNFVLIGAGGGAKAIAVMLAEEKANFLFITDIIEERANNLATYISSLFETKAISCKLENSELKKAIDKCDVLINATPVGMYPKIEDSPLSDNIQIPSGILVYDIIYNPPETKLLKKAKESGAKTINGIGMLVRQGALSFSIFTGKEAPIETMKKSVLKALKLS